MAEPLKNMYNPAFFERLCPVLKTSIPGFDCRAFIFKVFDNSWPDLELKQRVRQIAITLHQFLPQDFPDAAQLLVKLAKNLREAEKREQGFETIFIPEYIQVYGLGYPDEALAALEQITKLVSGEFAIRPFILRYPEKTMKKMLAWSKHHEASVRRLSSEGCRPRLPWAMGLPEFKRDPSIILPILENLKEDPSEYVRRSVANNLNDIAKDHPEVVLSIAEKWQGKTPFTDSIIRHACRTMMKRGHHHALTLHGFDPRSKGNIKKLEFSKKVKIGQHLDFSFDFISKEKRAANFRLEYAIDYCTLSGKMSRKVFQIAENKLSPGECLKIQRKRPFKHFTTRKIYKGKHQITLLANGKKIAAGEFMVC